MALVIVAPLVIKGFPSNCGNCVTLECGTSTENIIEIQLFLLSCHLQKIKCDNKRDFVLGFKAWPVKRALEIKKWWYKS